MHSTLVLRLFRAESRRQCGRARRLVGNADTAEDLVQQAFANLLGRCAQAPLDPSAAYLARAVRNLAFNHLRDARRRAAIEIEGADLECLADQSPSPEMVVLHRAELRRLLQAVADLPERRRQAFVLSRIEGLSHDQVAERMSLSRHTVISHIILAMADLDRVL
jgi:RNA polymerase sigma factor (sigma-70 family)